MTCGSGLINRCRPGRSREKTRWWRSRGANASFTRDEEGRLLVDRRLRWGRSVVHIFDQGFAGAFWLGVWCLRMRADGKSNSPGGSTKANWLSRVHVCGEGRERAKLLAMATLAYAFLLQLLAPCYESLRLWLLRTFCHRTGWHLRCGSRQGPVVPPALCAEPLVATLSTLLCRLGKAAPRCLCGDHYLGRIPVQTQRGSMSRKEDLFSSAD